MDQINSPLQYAPAIHGSNYVQINSHQDGGVTVIVPRGRTMGWHGELAFVVIGVVAMCVGFLLAGGTVGTISTLIGRVIRSPDLMVMALIVALPMTLWVITVAIRYRMGHEPDVVGISPTTVYVNVGRWLSRKTFEVPRNDLLEVTLLRYPRSPTNSPRCVKVRIRNRGDAWIGGRCQPSEILQIAKALADAQDRTKASTNTPSASSTRSPSQSPRPSRPRPPSA